jgi:transketolase
VKSIRQVFGETILALATEDDRIVISDAEFDKGANLTGFASKYPERFFEVGIAEQNEFAIAAGLATCGLIPVTGTFAVFASTRALDQVRNGICLSNLNVKIFGSHAGLEVGFDGGTHQGLEDIAIMRTMPNLRVLVPSTPIMAKELVREMIYSDGPVYMRFGREPADEFYGSGEKFAIGGSKLLRNGQDITLIACGNMVKVAVEAADKLKKQGIQARVIDMYSIKPIDETAIIAAATQTRGIVTVEDHNVIGGLGGAVCEVTAANKPCKVLRVGTDDCFGRSGAVVDLMKRYGLTSEHVASVAEGLLYPINSK